MKLTPKGMRDFLPDDMILREQVIETIKMIYRKYGFVPLETPVMEYLNTLKSKAGEEVEKQIFVLEGREYGLRFDLTVPLARVAATNAFTKPFKRYCISRVWRHEEPQKGRFREFWQSDIDTIGSESMKADAEILRCAHEVVTTLGFDKPRILINNRKIMNGLAKKLGVGEKIDELLRILDKMDKVGKEGVKKHLAEHFDEKRINEVFSLISLTGTNKQKIESAKRLSEDGAKELEEIIALLPDVPVEIDLSLVRGLGYYTGPVFEIKLSDEIGSVAGGGRYDHLLEKYGQKDCATGISIGIERILYLLNERIKKRGKQSKKTFTQVFVACVKPEFYDEVVKIANEIRKGNVDVETDLNNRNLRKQLEYVNVMGIPYVIVVGEKEVKSKKGKIRNMESGEEREVELYTHLMMPKGNKNDD
ncbi:MAG: histidine--tRNA ligase [Candidatus Micrarchaeota archaeon]